MRMSALQNIKVRVRLPLVPALALVALIVVAVVALTTVNEVKVGGDLQQDIARQNELLADILPPPAYLVETHLDTQSIVIAMGVGDVDEAKAIADGLTARGELFGERHDLW